MSRIHIKGGTIVTMDPAVPDLARGDILIENGKIAAIAETLDGAGAEVIDAGNMIVIPGLINSHIHTWQSALRGIAADWTVAQYMQAMHRGLATLFRPEDIYIANLMGALNQINSGTTTLVDWYHNNPTPDHTNAAVRGLDESGIRALFLHGSPKPNPKPGQKHFSEVPMPRSEVERLLKGRFASKDGLLTMGLAILGPYYSVYEVTRTDVLLAKELGLMASMHVGGGKPMVADGHERLLKEKLVGPHYNIVHGNDVAPETVRAIVGEGGTFVVTAEVELQMGYGDPLTGLLQQCNSPVTIGSDVEPAARGDMFTAMRVTLQHERNRWIIDDLQKTGKRPETMPVTTRHALEWATINGARVAGLADRTGSLTPGKQADIVLLRADDLAMFPVRNPIGSVVMQGGVSSVDTVFIAGRAVKRNGKLLFAGLDARKAELAASGNRIMEAFDALPGRAA
ncbi:MAG: amidohydrolase family protein [Pseudorhodoplanes sp.]|jgi:cytosine/adenosine deaminase-related metal-dependent hydrolase|nr:amidohydrolase family protein [Pseudorhodoplanes sp.]